MPEPRQPDRRSRLAIAASGALVGAAAVLGWAVVADAGPFTPNATQPPIAFPILYAYDANPEPEEYCGQCHANYDPTVGPFELWSGTMMANSARDPVFWAALDVANNDLPGIGEYCLRCHAPKAWLEGRASAEVDGDGNVIGVGDADGCSLQGFVDDTSWDPSTGDTGTDFEGVTCHVCHRMMIEEMPPPGEDGNYLENAEYWIDDEPCPDGVGSGPCRRGPYDYPAGGDPEPPHEWAFSPYHQDSQICATCHNVTNPVLTLIDETGTDTGILYPIERTYDEWNQSDFRDGGPAAQTCQNCHMPDATDPNSFACSFANTDRAGDLPKHEFVGGNSWVPALLGDPNWGLTLDNGTAFADTADRARAMLESAAQLEVTAPSVVGPEATLRFDVRVTNLSGHKLPTGYVEGRRMWVHVEVRDADDTLIYESGAYDPATGVLTRDADIKVYETVRGIWDRLGNSTCDHTNGSGVEEFHFVLNDCIALDNRIPPAGFTGGGDIETRPVGYSYPETAPGSGVLVHWDDTSYEVPLPVDAVPPLSVDVELRYQTSSKEYIDFLRNESVANGFADDCTPRSSDWSWPAALPAGSRSRGEWLHWLWETIDRSTPHVMELAAASVDIDADIFSDGFESGDTTAWSATIP